MFSEIGLHERLLKALNELDFTGFTPVQAQAIPLALQGKDLLISAETGSGKTAAFLLPVMQHLLENDSPLKGTQALVLVPTRELARQVFKHFKALGSFTHLQAEVIIGGDEFKYQKACLRKNPHIVIATPGRLLEHLEKASADLADLEVLVLDEADRMLDMGFSEDVQKIAAACNPLRQSLLLSATLNHRGISPLVAKLMREPETVIVGAARTPLDNIEQQVILADDLKHKEQLLAALLESEKFERAIVFTNTRVQANKLGGLLRYHKQRVGVLHGDMSQVQRDQVMSLFRGSKINVLVATDVAARGLDIKGTDLVVNFDMARNGDDYVHRIGRTGRAGEQGLAIAFIMANEWNLKSGIERYLRVKFKQRKLAGLEGNYKGPKKLKASGKSAGSKKKKTVAENKKASPKNTKKARQKTAVKTADREHKVSADGFKPLRKKR